MKWLLLPAAWLALMAWWLAHEWQRWRYIRPIEKYALRHGLSFAQAQRYLNLHPEEIDR